LEVTDTSVESETNVIEQTTEQNEINPENKEEPMITTNSDEVILPGLDLNTDDNEKKRKRTPSQVKRMFKKVIFCNDLCVFRRIHHLNERKQHKKKVMIVNHQQRFKHVNVQFIRNYYLHLHFLIVIVVVI
jgi:hypothetical protein